jgi:lysophospholipase L1-like esterase
MTASKWSQRHFEMLYHAPRTARPDISAMKTLLFVVLISNPFAGWARGEAAPSPTLQILAERLDWDEKRLADWPNLARYREENAVLAPPGADETRVVFMGDSITDAWGREQGVFFPGKPYINRGISGQTTPQMLLRFRPDVIALKPRVVVILAGTNDLAGNTGPATLAAIEGNLTSMTELAQANGIKVVLASVLPVNDYNEPRTADRPPAKILELNGWMKEYAKRKAVVYLDYYSALLDENHALKKSLSGDGLHPNAAGYAVMAPLAERAIERAQ